MKKIYAEIGIGNKSFLSTEIEEKNKEFRIRTFIFPEKLKEIYFRLWVFRFVIILSFFKGIFLRKKSKNNFKFLIGFGGVQKI